MNISTSSANFNTVRQVQKIDRAAIDSVKSAIFQKVDSRAEDNSQTKQTVKNTIDKSVYNTFNLSSMVRNDMMTQARENVAKPEFNPFTAKAEQPAKSVVENQLVQLGKEVQISNENTKQKVIDKLNMQSGLYNASIREAMMAQSQAQMTKKNDLMSQLTFLNTKTAIQTYSSSAKSF